MEGVTDSPKPVNRRTTSCQTCHRRKVACDLGAPCSACKKHALTLKKDPMSMICIYPCSPNELKIRRASYDDRLLAQKTEDEELGVRRRRTRSATALEGALDDLKVKDEPKEGSGRGGSPTSPSFVELKIKPKRRKSKEQKKVKAPVVEEPIREDFESSSREHKTTTTEQEPEHFIHSSILRPIGHDFHIFNQTPIYNTHTPMPPPFAYPDPFAEPASVPAFADPLPPAFITIFGSGTSLHSPIRSLTPMEALSPRPQASTSDSGSDEPLGDGFLSDSSPSSTSTNFTSPYEEYIAMVDQGYFAMWE
ncbi:hypothetical protein BCR35DRAFT_328813 [Leucosporidium creatinivorum]|uniref:Zn(2)-C6 fungal-type domain-containing protein n=1 Tax=Leucosporidium creatinivorum TaxID=106004 RepID=A0A1Y2G1X8_9BASI|nr:hypothetical protein BCR35DRAFT_328813 [Leucosporidium creatinivorum]